MLKMTIDALMRKVNTRSASTLDRDIQIVQTYFGLGNQKYPTYESIANEFEIGSRQRAQQIVYKKFVDRINREDYTIIQSISQIIEEKEISFVDDVLHRLNEEGFIEGDAHIRGLFRLLKTFGSCIDYEIYNVEIEEAAETDYINKETLLLIKNGKQDEVKEHMRTLKGLPGMHGMVNYLDVISKNSWLKEEEIALYRSLILHSNTAKVFFETGENNFWYMFEDRDNIIINALEKVANITNRVKAEILAETIQSDISKRRFSKTIPSPNLIKQYFLNSSVIEMCGEYAIIKAEKGSLTNIEMDIYHYFITQNKDTVSFSEINQYLEKKGYSEPNRKQKLYHCSFVYVDRSKGRGNYELKLISQFTPLFGPEKNRYEKYKNLLKKLKGKTDYNIDGNQRTEQYLLKKWLFDGKETEQCAICGRTFSCKSLVTAHKKKRANCTDEERTDPNIVMPVCLFGCDYLYEHGYIRIQSGVIKSANTEALQATEIEYLQGLENRRVHQRWLNGSESYFERAARV